MSRFSKTTDELRAEERPAAGPGGDYPPGLLELTRDLAGAVGHLKRIAYTMETVRLRGSRRVSIAPPGGVLAAGKVATITTSPARLKGWSLLERGGAQAVTVQLIDGDLDAGEEGLFIEIDAGKTSNSYCGDDGIAFVHGITVVILSGTGTPAGSLFLDQS